MLYEQLVHQCLLEAATTGGALPPLPGPGEKPPTERPQPRSTEEETSVEAYVGAAEQLVVEVFVRDIARSRAFYQALGFDLIEDKGEFLGFAWEGHKLFLDQRTDLPPAPELPQANVRIMVANVDHYWELARSLGARVLSPICDQDYGIRDFTIADPDGFGLRFGSWLSRLAKPAE